MICVYRICIFFSSHVHCLSTQGEVGKDTCIDCAIGNFNNATGQQTCTPCELSYYAASTAMTVCSKCNTGFATQATGQGSCEYCSAGYYMFSEKNCQPCPTGSYTAATHQLPQCTVCELGRYNSATTQTACSSCAAGTYAAVTGTVECTSCEAGRYNTATGFSHCSSCEAGKRASLASKATSCADCDNGQYAAAGAIECSTCAAGSYSNSIMGRAACTFCARGTYSAAEKSSTCDNCGAGRYAEAEGSSSCKNCEVGKATEAVTASTCPACAVNFFANSTGMSSCVACPDDLQAPDEGSTFCFYIPPGCLRGYYNIGTSDEFVCEPCPLGSYNNEYAQTACKPCPRGTYTSVTGRSYCDACAVGRYVDTTGAQTCIDCPLGRYASTPGHQVCAACAMGHTTLNTGRTLCDQCQSGTIAPFEGLPQCEDCIRGKYNALSAASACSECPAQTVTNTAGSKTITDCGVVICPLLSALGNGLSVSLSQGIFGTSRIGSVATYSCLSGFILVGETTRTCIGVGSTTGVWTGTQPSCVSSATPSNPPVARGMIWQLQPQPSVVTSNAAQFPTPPEVAIVDSSGNVITDGSADTYAVLVSVSIPAASLSSSALAGSNRLLGLVRRYPFRGVVVLTGLSVLNVGTMQLVATASGLSQAVSSSFTIVRGAQALARFVSFPMRVVNGATITTAVNVSVTDAWGNIVTTTTTGRAPRVTLALSDSTVVFNGLQGNTVSADCVNGIATFTSLTIAVDDLDTASSRSVAFVATGSDLQSAHSADVTVYGALSNAIVEEQRESARSAAFFVAFSVLQDQSSAIESFMSYYQEQYRLDVCAALALSTVGCRRVQLVSFVSGTGALRSPASFTALAVTGRAEEDAAIAAAAAVDPTVARYVSDPYLRDLLAAHGGVSPLVAAARADHGVAGKYSSVDASPTPRFETAALPAEPSTAASGNSKSMSPLATSTVYSAHVQLNPPLLTETPLAPADTLAPRELGFHIATQVKDSYSVLRVGAVSSLMYPSSFVLDVSGNDVVSLGADYINTGGGGSVVDESGFKIGIGIGAAVVGIALIVGLIYCCCFRRRSEREELIPTAPVPRHLHKHPVEATVDMYSTTPNRSNTPLNQTNNAKTPRQGQRRMRRAQPMNV